MPQITKANNKLPFESPCYISQEVLGILPYGKEYPFATQYVWQKCHFEMENLQR